MATAPGLESTAPTGGAPAVAMQQVTRSNKSLLTAINDGDVPRPVLMDWNSWQIWRRGEGSRPSSAADGAVTSTTLESQLWKGTMAELYGPEWSVALAEQTSENPAIPVVRTSTLQSRIVARPGQPESSTVADTTEVAPAPAADAVVQETSTQEDVIVDGGPTVSVGLGANEGISRPESPSGGASTSACGVFNSLL